MNHPAIRSQSRDVEDLATLYTEHAAWLAAVASRKFQVPRDDSEMLVQEVFLTYAERQRGTRCSGLARRRDLQRQSILLAPPPTRRGTDLGASRQYSLSWCRR